MLPPLVIAIDGFSSSGKSTFAKIVARKMGYAYIDTGAMYRAVTLFALQNGIIQGDCIDRQELAAHLDKIDICFRRNQETGENETYLNGKNVEKEIRGLEVSEKVSDISTIKEVRVKLVSMQQAMGKYKSVVMDGRDIGTGVFPDADIKIFLTASVDVRTRRRYDELIKKGIPASYEEISKNIAKRDHIDQTRTESPLKKAPDAVILDNSDMTLQQQLEWFNRLLENITRQNK